MLKMLRNIILWSYERGSWQYDVLCLLILAFIFLTPSSLFKKPDQKPAAPAHQEEPYGQKSFTNNGSQATEKKQKESKKRRAELPAVDKEE
jgi:hypothetical protein